jgi:type II secretory pathway pseudopilin PulG
MTLIELLLTIAILLALAMLAWSSLAGVMRDRVFESTCDRVEHQLILARAQAQIDSDPVEVVHLLDPPRLVARPWRMQPDKNEHPHDDSAQPESLRGDALPWAWAVEALGRGIVVRPDPGAGDEPEQTIQRDPADAALALATGTSAAGDADEPRRLVVFLPDGSPLRPVPFVLSDGEGRQARIELSRWTGLPRIDRRPERTPSLAADEGGSAPFEPAGAGPRRGTAAVDQAGDADATEAP